MEVGYCESEYEAAMLDLLVSLGWTQSGGDELYRKYSDALILDDLRSYLQQRFPDFTPEELERIIFNLSNSGAATDYLALRATASLFRVMISPCRINMWITSILRIRMRISSVQSTSSRFENLGSKGVLTFCFS